MARAAATLPAAGLPLDVRMTAALARALGTFAALVLLAALAWWLGRQPLFQMRGITLEGELTHQTMRTLRAQVSPRISGNFFTIDLEQARETFERVPWVRRAVVRRVWPDHLAVRIEEHKAAALWVGDDGNDRLVNTFGEVFDANVAEVEDEDLPRLSGPAGSSARLLEALRALAPVLAPLQQPVVTLRLSGRGSWRAVLADGAVIELGRGEVAEIAARAGTFVRTLPQVRSAYPQPLLRADLRHPDGYALRLKGVTTAAPRGRTPGPN
ncbi:MAG: cell division protein FtsQ/DivIB [Burkholderiaceae bacterium]